MIPVYLIVRHHLGDRIGPVIAGLAFLGYPAVHGIVLSDFHSLALLAPVALWMVYFLDRGFLKAYAIAGALVVLVREDAALFAAGIGVYAIASGQRKLGAITIAAALAYLAVVKLFVMPDAGLLMENAENAYPYANRYRRLIPPGGGARDGIATLLTNPSFTLTHVIQRAKLVSLLGSLLPLGLLPLFAGRRLWLCAYGFAFCFLATHDWIYYPLFHYQSVLYPMLFAALPLGMLRAQNHIQAPRLQAALLTTTILASLTTASWIPTDTFALHTPIARTLTEDQRAAHAWLKEAALQIPKEASLSASNRTAPHLSNRPTLHVIQQEIQTDWIVVHNQDLTTDDATWLRNALHNGDYETVNQAHDHPHPPQSVPVTKADKIWNRACLREFSNPGPGDRALGDLLLFHGLAMNGGVLHAIECCSADELRKAAAGYAFYGFAGVEPLIERGRIGFARGDETELDRLEAELDRAYEALIPTDQALADAFELHFAAHPEGYEALSDPA